MRTYNKPALTIDQQITLLEQRGLAIPDKARAKRHLSNVSYYRLSAYMLPYRVLDASGSHLDQFVSSATWDDIYTLCIILYLLETVNPKTNFRKHFRNLLTKYPNVNVGYMGFPAGWENHPLWK